MRFRMNPMNRWLVLLAGLAALGLRAGPMPAQPMPAAEPEPGHPALAVAALDTSAVPAAAAEPWVRTSEERAWETILEATLGNSYLPGYKDAKAKGLETAWDFVRDDPALPRVLLIGDSISRGYTVPVRRALAGKANVHRAPRNCGSTLTAFSTNKTLKMQQLELWLGTGRWDVIHFNFGIHDCHGSLPDYTNRIEQIVRRLEQTGARLIFAASAWGHDPDDLIVPFNRAAAELMGRLGVPVNDLYGAMKPRVAEFRIAPDNSHFQESGNQFLGERVAAAIRDRLPGMRHDSSSRH